MGNGQVSDITGSAGVTGGYLAQLFYINQSEESSKININAHTTSCQLPITSAAHYNRIYSNECQID